MKKQLMILAIAGLTFMACKKNDDLSKNRQLLKKITEIDNGDSTFTDFSYDNNERLVSIKTEDNETKLTYSGINIIKVENKIDSDKNTLEVTYEGGKPKSAIYKVFEENNLTGTFKVTYTLNATNQVTEILMKDSANINVISKQVLTYTNNNITKVQSYLGTTLIVTQEFTYGTKKSQYNGSKPNYVVDVFLAELHTDNELVKQKYTVGDVNQEVTNTYTYDGGGFPLKADVSEKTLPNGTPELRKLVFTY